jgi:hypothetical protein
MPKPPILPIIDWKSIFEGGEPYEKWIQTGEFESNRKTMQELRGKLKPTAEEEAIASAVHRPVNVLAIAEDWCPDVVRHVPVLMNLAAASDKVHVRFIEREGAPDAFARYLTLGGEAVPKFVFLSDKFVECGGWGPMPSDCREFIARGKATGDMKGARQKVFQKYQADPECRTAFGELAHLIGIAGCKAP